MKYLIIILFLISICCQSQNSKYDLIQGSWGATKESNVDFTFKGNQIIYFEDLDKYTFDIKESTLTIKQDGELITTYEIIFLSKEKLILKANDGSRFTLVRIN